MQFLSYHCDYEIKGTGTDRRIKGYASVFGNVDAAGDIVSPGAFKRSINDAMDGSLTRSKGETFLSCFA